MGRFLIFAILWFMDTVFTLQFVAQGGSEMETNPVMRAVFEHEGPIGFIAIKAVTLFLLWLSIPYVRPWLITTLSVVMLPVVAISASVLILAGPIQ